MLGKTKIALAAAIVLGAAVTASAATKQPRATQGHPATYNAGRDNNSCPASGGPSCSDACLPSGPPCRTHRDSA
jgi:hypothetical protein